MDQKIKKQLNNLEEKEQKLIQKSRRAQEKKEAPAKRGQWGKKLRGKIPDKLAGTLNAAFCKGFSLIFEKGASWIEKTYDKKKITGIHEMQDRLYREESSRRRLRQLDQQAKKTKWINTAVAAAEGGGLGLFGIGLPDIPLFLALLLKGIYETALSYGFAYDSDQERIYILNLIAAALTEEDKDRANLRADEIEAAIDAGKAFPWKLDEEIRRTSNILATNLMMVKFLQSVLIVGAVAGIANVGIYRKAAGYAALKYKKRYLKTLQRN